MGNEEKEKIREGERGSAIKEGKWRREVGRERVMGETRSENARYRL